MTALRRETALSCLEWSKRSWDESAAVPNAALPFDMLNGRNRAIFPSTALGIWPIDRILLSLGLAGRDPTGIPVPCFGCRCTPTSNRRRGRADPK